MRNSSMWNATTTASYYRKLCARRGREEFTILRNSVLDSNKVHVGRMSRSKEAKERLTCGGRSVGLRPTTFKKRICPSAVRPRRVDRDSGFVCLSGKGLSGASKRKRRPLQPARCFSFRFFRIVLESQEPRQR